MKWNPEKWQKPVSTCLVKRDTYYSALQINPPHSPWYPISLQVWMFLITWLRKYIRSKKPDNAPNFLYFACGVRLPRDLMIQCLYSLHHPAVPPTPLQQNKLLLSALVRMDNSLKMIPILWTKKTALNPPAWTIQVIAVLCYRERRHKGVFDWHTT